MWRVYKEQLSNFWEKGNFDSNYNSFEKPISLILADVAIHHLDGKIILAQCNKQKEAEATFSEIFKGLEDTEFIKYKKFIIKEVTQSFKCRGFKFKNISIGDEQKFIISW